MKKIFIFSFYILLIGFCARVEAAGLNTTFSEVTLENLQTGRTYSSKQTAGLPLTVVNTGKTSVDLKIELMMPEASELKAGFLPIPSLSWIKLEKYDFKNIGPDQSAQTDVIITIPSSTQYQNKKYQVYIWTHTVEGAIRIGLKSRLLLVIKGGNRALR